MFRLLLPLLILIPIFSAKAQAPSASQLDGFLRQYEAAGHESGDRAVESLIRLDRELRAWNEQRWWVDDADLDRKSWERYSPIGIYLEDNELVYAGTLLGQAKTRDIHKKYGTYTAYLEICGGAGAFSGCAVYDVPDIAAASRYEKNYPNGPFIEDTLIILGHFYDDLYKALKAVDQTDYKHDCYAPYFTKEPLDIQAERARRIGVQYYDKVLAGDAINADRKQSIRGEKDELEAGTSDGWYFCAD